MSRKKSSSSLHTIFNSAGGKLCAAITLCVYHLINVRHVSRCCCRHHRVSRPTSHPNRMSLMSSCHCVSLSPTSKMSYLCSCGLTMSLCYGLPSLSLTMSMSLLYGYDPQSLRLLGLTMSCEMLSCPLCLGLQKSHVKEYLSLRCCLRYLYRNGCRLPDLCQKEKSYIIKPTENQKCCFTECETAFFYCRFLP